MKYLLISFLLLLCVTACNYNPVVSNTILKGEILNKNYDDHKQLILIYEYINIGKLEFALLITDNFIQKYSQHKYINFIYYIRSIIHYEMNYSMIFRILPLDISFRSSEFADQGLNDFQQFLDKFYNSKYRYDGKNRMIILSEQIANHNLNIAQYYINKGLDLAIINRVEFIINKFPQTKAISNSLLIINNTYKKYITKTNKI